MRILWIHNFDPADRFSGIFMKQMVEPLREIGINVDLYYIGRLRRELMRLPKTIENLNEACKGYDIIHVQYGSLSGYIVSRIEGTKIMSLRGSDWYRIRRMFPLVEYLHGAASVMFSRLALGRYHNIITMSNRMTREVKNVIPDTTVHTLPDAIYIDRFQQIERSEARRHLGIPEDQKWVVFAAILKDNPIKRPYLAKDAVKIAREKDKTIVLKPLCDIPHEEMPYYYSAADAIITTSVHEGWPNCIKEALACNLPFIATDTSDLGEIADQEPSCHVCADNPQALAEALLDTLSQKRPDNLRRHVESMDMSVFVKDLAEIYRKTLQSG